MICSILSNYAAPIIAGVIGMVFNYYYNKPKLISFYGSISIHKLKNKGEDDKEVYTHEIVVRNSGKVPLHNVRIGHKYLQN